MGIQEVNVNATRLASYIVSIGKSLLYYINYLD